MVDKMKALVQALRCGNAITLENRWDQLRSIFVEVNSGDVENFDDEFRQLIAGVPALLMLEQPRSSLSDLNGRKPMVQIEDKSHCDKLEAENAALRNQVGQMAASLTAASLTVP